MCVCVCVDFTVNICVNFEYFEQSDIADINVITGSYFVATFCFRVEITYTNKFTFLDCMLMKPVM